MDGVVFSHSKHYSSPTTTNTVSSGTYSHTKYLPHLYLLLILILISSCTEGSDSTNVRKTERKISSSLHSVIEELKSNTHKDKLGLTFTDKAARINEQGEIQIYIQLYEIDESKLENLKKHGVTIDIYDNKQKLVQGWALPKDIRTTSELPYVKSIDLPAYGVSN